MVTDSPATIAGLKILVSVVIPDSLVYARFSRTIRGQRLKALVLIYTYPSPTERASRSIYLMRLQEADLFTHDIPHLFIISQPGKARMA